MASQDVRSQILEAAGPVFAERGYRDATVREICSAAGVNVAAVNYHFGDKSQLYYETVTLAHRRRASQIPMPSWQPGDPPEQKIRGFVATLMQRMIGCQENPWPTQLLLREVLQPTEACRALVKDYFRPQLELLLSILDEFLPAGTAEHRRTQLAFSVIGQCLFYRVAGDLVPMVISKRDMKTHFQIDDLVDHISAVSIAVLKSESSPWQNGGNIRQHASAGRKPR